MVRIPNSGTKATNKRYYMSRWTVGQSACVVILNYRLHSSSFLGFICRIL